uniref:Putative secreted protein n=1 Tax=Ixodes ricinus TaxID=34613 RepID=A0A6B0TS26_IXORI
MLPSTRSKPTWFSSSTVQMALWSLAAARCNAVCFCSVRSFTLAPARIRLRTMISEPASTARCRGVSWEES